LAALALAGAVPILTDMSVLQACCRRIALLRRDKALILAKNVLYKQNPMKMKNAATDALPLSGALFFAALPKGLDRGRAFHA
jgi:hypothetical protein